MQIQDQILTTLPVFEVSDTLKEVIKFFEETTFSHIGVVEDGTYLGLLAENDLGCFEPDKKIEEFRFSLETFHVTKETSWLDVLENFARNEANVTPVLSGENTLMGYYYLNDVVGSFIGTPFFTEPGGILVVAKGIKDYSFSEISQIVESNNAKLLGAFVTGNQNDVIEITMKINNGNLNEITQTFRRYNYTILFGNNDDQFMEDLKQRSDYLDKYLNV
ncbi:CBS domain-containing protein [Allomuricauda sp. SCSIO 65647]|uniref:CBS domain-containing protein n=1 Tax=Allomuricauda sp. SCSIO 65647 TaxID=2908843 RepID=UPI001F24DEF5|nr:CBS domain-containing protein [Muricauda sp. SCSIO 65647]UJH68297.1 CBS domain-containing protein [Muricauda sp. SCSIO 65647]